MQIKVEEKGLLITLVLKIFQLKFLYFVCELADMTSFAHQKNLCKLG